MSLLHWSFLEAYRFVVAKGMGDLTVSVSTVERRMNYHIRSAAALQILTDERRMKLSFYELGLDPVSAKGSLSFENERAVVAMQ